MLINSRLILRCSLQGLSAQSLSQIFDVQDARRERHGWLYACLRKRLGRQPLPTLSFQSGNCCTEIDRPTCREQVDGRRDLSGQQTLIKNILIASHSYDEAITRCVIKNRACFESKISIVLLSDILFNFDIYDDINDSCTIVKWYKNDDLFISNKSHNLLNRVLYFPDSLFSNFIPEDKDYAQREFEAYIGFSFNAFFGVSNKTTTGLCEKALSLPEQWTQVSKECDVRIPTYYWGPATLNPLSGSHIVTSDIYNYLNWHPKHPTRERDHIFCFEKPKGEAVFVLVMGSKMLITSDIRLTASKEKIIFELSKQISILTQYFIAEILFFIEGKTVTFGCINANIIKSVKNIHFDAFVIKNLVSEFILCAN